MKADDAGEFKERGNENVLLKKLLAEAELEKAALEEITRENSEPDRQTKRSDDAPGSNGALTAFRLQNCRATAIDSTESACEKHSGDPDQDLRKWLRDWIKVNVRKGFRRVWADLCAAGWVINKKKVQRLWREEGLRVKVRKIGERAGASTTPIAEVDAPKVFWAIDFQFDSTTNGRKFSGRVDGRRTHPSVRAQHRREIYPGRGSRRHFGEGVRALGRPTASAEVRHPSSSEEALRMFCEHQVGIDYVSPGQPWKNGYIESFDNRVREKCLNMNEFHGLLEALVVIEDWKEDYNTRHRHLSLAYRTPYEYAASCIHTR